MFGGFTAPRGEFTRTVIPRAIGLDAFTWEEVKRLALPQRGLSDEVNEWRLGNSRKVVKRWKRIERARKFHNPMLVGSFGLAAFKRDGYYAYGLAGFEVVTNAFVELVVDELQSSTGGIALFKWHNSGLSSTASPAATDTGLTTELGSSQISGGGRASGTQTEGSSTNIYQTVGTITIDASTIAIVESGIFNSSSTGAATLLDRDTFAVINLSSGESLQTTYSLTVPSGG